MMERDLNFRKLFKMYIKNIWLMVAIGLCCAMVVGMLLKDKDDETVINSKVWLVYDLEESDKNILDVKKTIYFDAYKGILTGNVLISDEDFTAEEQEQLMRRSIEVESSCYTVSLTADNEHTMEETRQILNKFIGKSEQWMREKYGDESLNVEILNESNAVMRGSESNKMKIALGFIVGAILTALALFVWFVMDRKIRDEEDVYYYTGVECIGTVKKH